MSVKDIIEAVKNGSGELARDESSAGPAPSDNAIGRFFSEIGSELKHQGAAGAHELAAGLLRGDAFVMYGGRDGVEQDVKPWEQQPAQEQAQEVKPQEKEQDKGMEMEM